MTPEDEKRANKAIQEFSDLLTPSNAHATKKHTTISTNTEVRLSIKAFALNRGLTVWTATLGAETAHSQRKCESSQGSTNRGQVQVII